VAGAFGRARDLERAVGEGVHRIVPADAGVVAHQAGRRFQGAARRPGRDARFQRDAEAPIRAVEHVAVVLDRVSFEERECDALAGRDVPEPGCDVARATEDATRVAEARARAVPGAALDEEFKRRFVVAPLGDQAIGEPVERGPDLGVATGREREPCLGQQRAVA
jgi:hypothetical protein